MNTNNYNTLNRVINRLQSIEASALNTGWEDIIVMEGAVHRETTRDNPDTCTEQSLKSWISLWMTTHLNEPIRFEQKYLGSYLLTGNKHTGVYLYDYCGHWGYIIPALLTYFHAPKPTSDSLKPILDTHVQTLSNHIMEKAVRRGNGIIVHGGFSYSAWVDTLYYTAYPLALMYKYSGDKTLADESIRQCLLHAQYLRDPSTGVFFHDAEIPQGKRTANYWARGNGWIIQSLAEVLTHLPNDMDGMDEVRKIYLQLVEGLLRLRHSTGLWRIIPEDERSHLETSGSLMIAGGIARGIRLGLLEDYLTPNVLASYHELLTWIDNDGRIMGSEQPAGRGGWEQHKLVPLGESTYTTGFFLKLHSELLKLNAIPMEM